MVLAQVAVLVRVVLLAAVRPVAAQLVVQPLAVQQQPVRQLLQLQPRLAWWQLVLLLWL